jgi:RNA polymerase sigma-70 factor (ECF subfamily)
MTSSAHSEGARETARVDSLIGQESRRLYGIAFSILRDPAEAEDAVQETLIKALLGWSWHAPDPPPAAWLTRVCVNQCLNSHRNMVNRIRLARLVGQRHRHQGDDPRDLDLERAFRVLSARQRTALALRYYHGYSVEESAELMGTRPGTVKSHLARGLERLRRELTL